MVIGSYHCASVCSVQGEGLSLKVKVKVTLFENCNILKIKNTVKLYINSSQLPSRKYLLGSNPNNQEGKRVKPAMSQVELRRQLRFEGK